MLHICATTVVGVGCSSDFPNAPDQAVTLEAVAWPSELHMSDSTIIEIRVRIKDSQQEVTGLRVQWESSDDAVLRVTSVPDSGSHEDTLVAQRHALIKGMSGGSATVRVTVEPGAGFEQAESTYVVQVTQKWIAVSAGSKHTCGINVDSLLYCWGDGTNGKLGTGLSASAKPAPVVALGDFKFIGVSAGDESTCGIIREHAAFCWGSNVDGRLGNGDPNEISRSLPTPVSGTFFSSVEVGRVVCGLGVDLRAWCWGTDVQKQLGAYVFSQPAFDVCLNSAAKCSRTPRLVSTRPPAPTNYRRVAVGGSHTCGISQAPDSLAFCWGTGSFGALGHDTVIASDTAIPVDGGFKFKVLAAGGDHTCGIANSGPTYCWGLNASGQLGHGGTGAATMPALITPGAFDSVTGGGQHTCALTIQGEAWCWGLGSSGQLGNNSTPTVQSFPDTVRGNLRFTSLSAGASHTCGVALDGSLYCWGRGVEGQLGVGPGDLANHSTPIRVVEP